MNRKQLFFSFVVIITINLHISLFGQGDSIVPVSPDPSPEAVALLNFINNISGRYILTGQHNFPGIKDRNSRFAAEYTGKTPVIFSTDWGHAEKGNTDSYLARPDIVQEAIRQYNLGAIITICWHAVPPTANEPVTFSQLPGTPPDSLRSVQGSLPDQQFKDVLTPGTILYNQWCRQVDSVAGYLKILQDAHVPVLWRPYHEMNGGWFWWGGRKGEYSSIALYKQLFARLTTYHKLNNLLWLWSIDRAHSPELFYSGYFPGTEYFDIVSLDVYRNDFNRIYYDSLSIYSNGKPMVLGEVGNPPSIQIINEQPRWAYYVTWAGMVRNTTKEQYNALFNDPRFLTIEDPVYRKLINQYRKECNLSPLPELIDEHSGFSGVWIFNEERSILGTTGASSVPYKLTVKHEDNDFSVKKTTILEFDDNTVTEENLTLDGKEYITEFRNTPKITAAEISERGDTITFLSKADFIWGDRTIEMRINEVWTLSEDGKILYVKNLSDSFWGKQEYLVIYDKRENE